LFLMVDKQKGYIERGFVLQFSGRPFIVAD